MKFATRLLGIDPLHRKKKELTKLLEEESRLKSQVGEDVVDKTILEDSIFRIESLLISEERFLQTDFSEL